MASSVDTKDVQTQAPQEADTASAPSNQQDAAMNEANTEILDSVEQRVGPARVKVGGTSEHFDLQGRRGSAPAEVASTHPDQRLRKTSAPEQSFSARGLQQFSAQIPQQHNTSSGTSPYLASNTGASMPDTLVTVPTDVPEQAAMTEANPSTDLISRRQHLADLKKAAHNTLSAFLPAREPSLHDKLETIKAEWGQIAAEIGHCNDVKLQTEKDLDFHFKVLVLPAPEKNDIHGKNLHCSRLRSQCRICLKDLCEQALWDARELSDIYSENGDTPGSHIIVVYLEHAQDSIETCAYTKKYFVEVVSRTCSCPGCRSKTQPLVGKLVGNMSIGWGSDALVSRVGSIFIGRPQQRVSRVSVEQRGFWAYTVMKEWVDRNGVTLAPELIEHPEGGNSEDGKDRNKKRQRGADDDDGEDGDDKEPSPKKRKVETGKSAAGSSKAPGKKTARAPGAIRVAQGETFATSKAAEVTTNGEQGKAPTLKKKVSFASEAKHTIAPPLTIPRLHKMRPTSEKKPRNIGQDVLRWRRRPSHRAPNHRLLLAPSARPY